MHYCIYGLHLLSNVPLFELLPHGGEDAVNLTYRQDSPSEETALPPEARLLMRKALSIGGWVAQYETPWSYILRFEERADFTLSADGSLVTCRPAPGVPEEWIRLTLYGLVLSFALFLKRIGNLHACGVVLPTGAVGLIGVPGTGKSTLAAALARAGYPLLCDDVLALHEADGAFYAMHGFPAVGMDPATLRHLDLDAAPLGASQPSGPKVRLFVEDDWGSFHLPPTPLRALYLLSRVADAGSRPSITTLGEKEAAQALFEHTPALEFLKKSVLAHHWMFVGRLVTRIPVREMVYPSGFERLPDAIECLLQQEQVQRMAER
jgi:hypothetical protein